jgi:hypothetical protein
MRLENFGSAWGKGERPWREHVRKTAIVIILVGLLLPPIFVNLGENAEQVKWAKPLEKWNQPLPTLQALLLCQQWTLFSEISPFNFKLHYLVTLTNGENVLLPDLDKERVGAWQNVFFPNEPKTELNLYADPAAQRRYLEYLVRINGIDPEWIVQRTIYMTYESVCSRQEAARVGTHYGPKVAHVLAQY